MIKTAMEQLVGAHRVREVQNPLHPEQSLLLLYLEMNIPVTILMTNGLSDYEMPVSEKWKGREFNEIFFCLPTYWNLEDSSNPNSNWVYDWIYRLETFAREKQTWFGPGHTIPCGNPPQAISGTMKQEYFIFLEPIFTKDALPPTIVDGKTVHFLSIVPMYGDEFDYKIAKGTYKFAKRFALRNNSEILDDYRASFLNSRFRFF